MKLIPFASSVLILFLVAMGMSAWAADGVGTGTPLTSDFVKNASIGGQFEIMTSELALERSQNNDVREFAQDMINDHKAANDKLKQVLTTAQLNITTTEILDTAHQTSLDEMKRAPIEDFNALYIKAQLSAHKEAVALFQDYSDKGDNTALKEFATQTLPTLQEHSKAVDKLSTSFTADKKTDISK